MMIGFIYKLTSKQTPNIYIGSSSNLDFRLKKHKQQYNNYCKNNSEFKRQAFELLQYPDCNIELIKRVEYINKIDLLKEEQTAMNQHKDIIINKIKSFNENENKELSNTTKNYKKIFRRLYYVRTFINKKINKTIDNNNIILLNKYLEDINNIKKDINKITNDILITKIINIKKLIKLI
jgi:predicted GIY-YIG superfamily endonuclease